MVDYALIAVIALLLLFIGWREHVTSSLINRLTNKLMARDFREYSVFAPEAKVEVAKTQDTRSKKPSDPVLGAIY